MTTWVYRPNHPQANANGMVDRNLAGYEAKGSAPAVISDSMEMTKHHGTGRMIGSKRAFSAETRRAGMVELGNEPLRARKPVVLDRGQRREAIRRSIYELRNGRG